MFVVCCLAVCVACGFVLSFGVCVLVVRCWLCVVCCCLLYVDCYSLRVTRNLVFVVRCLVFVVASRFDAS